MPEPVVGESVFVEDKGEGWLLGTLESLGTDAVVLLAEPHAATVTVPGKSVVGVVEGSLAPVPDLLMMPYLHAAPLLQQIRHRFLQKVIYTRIGPIVLAVNPYEYSAEDKDREKRHAKMEEYIVEERAALNGGSQQPTHSWSVAHDAYWSMRESRGPQTVLISGESGAGKTEAAKMVAEYLSQCSTHFATAAAREGAEKVTQRVAASSPVLEAFGNAKTVRNDNSSRFGKFMEIQFNDSGVLVGAHMRQYLLERSRTITHAEGERSFHVFYQLVAGATDEEKERYRLADRSAIGWIYAGGQGDEDAEKREREELDAAAHAEVQDALGVLGLKAEERKAVYDVVAGILHLRSVEFGEGEDGNAVVAGDAEARLRFVAELWGVCGDTMLEELLTSTQIVRGERIHKKLKQEKAAAQRDGLAKSLYEHLFSWLIQRLNQILKPTDRAAEGQWIGVLDIFGFENFKRNSLEQLCINLANEQLQGHYNRRVFSEDLAEYEEEGVVKRVDGSRYVFVKGAAADEDAGLQPPDNSATIKLLVGADGIEGVLNDSCKHAQHTDSDFMAELEHKYGKRGMKHPLFSSKPKEKDKFSVKHYAADVCYSVEGFREKNTDELKASLVLMMKGSRCPTIGALFPEVPSDDQRKGKQTVSLLSGFRRSLAGMVERIGDATPHWIRCIKPNPAKQVRTFRGGMVMEQLLCAGVLETVKIRQAGYGVRLKHNTFSRRYKPLAAGDPAPTSDSLLAALGVRSEDALSGRTKVFLKDDAYRRLEALRLPTLVVHAESVQAFARARLSGHVRHCRHLRSCAEVVRAAAAAKLADAARARLDEVRMEQVTRAAKAEVERRKAARLAAKAAIAPADEDGAAAASTCEEAGAADAGPASPPQPVLPPPPAPASPPQPVLPPPPADPLHDGGSVADLQRANESLRRQLAEALEQARTRHVSAEEGAAEGMAALDGSIDGASPERLAEMKESKKAALRSARRTLERLEREVVELEMRTRVAAVDSHIDGLAKEHVDSVNAMLRQAEQLACACGFHPSQMDFSVADLIAAVGEHQPQLSGGLPSELTGPLRRYLAEVSECAPSGEVATTPCLSKEQTLAVVTPPLLLLRDYAMLERDVEEWRQQSPEIGASMEIARRTAAIGGKTTENANGMSAMFRAAVDVLSQSSRATHERIELLRGAHARHRDLRSQFADEGAVRQLQQQHRAGIVELSRTVEGLPEFAEIGAAREAAAAKADDLRDAAEEMRQQLRRDAEALLEMDARVADQVRQVKFYSELIQQVDTQVSSAVSKVEHKMEALQNAAMLHDSQLNFVKAVGQELGASERVSDGMLAQCHQLFQICFVEWELLERIQNEDMAYVRKLQHQLECPDQLDGEKGKSVVELTRHLRATLCELVCVRHRMHQVADTIRGQSVTGLRCPGDISRFDVAAAGLEWPAEELLQACEPMWADECCGRD